MVKKLVSIQGIKHASIVYNRKIKKVGVACKMETILSSHVSRHSFTNLWLNMDNVNSMIYHNH
jgi:hypothetical protein